MSLAEVTALLGSRSTMLHAEAHDPRADHQALRDLVRWCQRFSPLVGWQTASSTTSAADSERLADCLLLEVTGLGALFGGEQVLAERVVEEFQQCSYTVRVAIANTIGAAWAIAHCGWGVKDPSQRGMAASGSIRPGPAAGAWVVPAEAQREVLAALPVEALRLESRQRQLLRQLGLARVEQLWRLDRKDLSSRLGANLLLRLDQALGTAEELIDVPAAPPRFAAQWQSDQPLENRRQVEAVLRQLIQQVAAEVVVREEGVMRLECWLESAGRDPLRLELGMFRPTVEARHMVELMQLQLERLVLPGPVVRIHVTAPLTAPREHRQQQLFAEAAREGQVSVARLLDRLRSRLGEQAVLRPRPQADAQPERAWRGACSEERVQGSGGRIQGARPLFLFCPALPLHVVAVAPDGPPARFFQQKLSRGPWIPVARCWGPERIETGWWRGRSVRRDYYRIETPTGSRFWIYRQRDSGQWYLHGEFG